MMVRSKEQNLNKKRMISLPVQVVVPEPATAEAKGGKTFSCYPGTMNRCKV